MSRVEVRKDRCKGCLLCTLVCPKKILDQSNEFNVNGYRVVQLIQEESDKCTYCGFCAIICPDNALLVYKDEKAA